MVAQAQRLFDGLQTDALLGQPFDREGAGGRTGGHDDVLVGNLDALDLALLRVTDADHGHLGLRVHRGDLAGEDLSVLQVLAVVDHSMARLDVATDDLRQEGLVGHVRQRVHHGDHTAFGLHLLLQQLGCGQADVAAADDQDTRFL